MASDLAGRTILYSGLSVFIGFAALSFAKFSFYRSAVSCSVGVLVLLAVLLTLNYFFMAVLGRKLFWPSHNFKVQQSSLAVPITTGIETAADLYCDF